MKTNYEFKALADGASELWLYDQIGNDWLGAGITAAMVRDDIVKAGPAARITVRINSPGGDVFEAAAIHSLLTSHKGPVDVVVDGVAASAASFIAMAGRTISMSGNAMLMIHESWGYVQGGAEDMERQAAMLRKLNANIAGTYASRTGTSIEQVQEWMKAETWFTADEAVEFNFANSKLEAVRAAACSHPMLSKYRNVPKGLVAQAELEGAAKTTSPNPVPKKEIPKMEQETNSVATPPVDPRAELKRYMSAFGPDGATWYAENKSFEDCQAELNSRVAKENEALKAQVADLTNKLEAQAKAAQSVTEPVSADDGDKPRGAFKTSAQEVVRIRGQK
jgi:ATP-dependent Clp endopeptidase proteolytic subunit ClpP